TFDLAESGGWYDIAVTLPVAPRFLRRFAGHHEDGRPATSDPGGYTHGPAPPNPRP
ncbi:MAG: phospholipase domain-containing protein, partial [Luteibacter sp.]